MLYCLYKICGTNSLKKKSKIMFPCSPINQCCSHAGVQKVGGEGAGVVQISHEVYDNLSHESIGSQSVNDYKIHKMILK